MVYYTENKGIVGPQHVEDAIGKSTEVCTVDVFMDDGIARWILSNPFQSPIQLIPEREIETR